MILVTGATGNVGAPLLQELIRSGAPVRAAALRPERLAGLGVPAVRLDFADPTTYGPALEGVTRLFLVRPPAIHDIPRTLAPFLDRSKAAGVEHVVFLSVTGAERNPVVPHHKVEQHILRTGLPYTFLRPSWFMQNLSTTYRAMIRDHGEICIPMGRARMSLIDARDIAAVAARALLSEEHRGRAYTITGSEAYDFGHIATVFSEVLGRPIRYPNPSIRQYRRRMAELGFPRGLINITTAMYLIGRLGLSAGLTPDTERILGRPPITLRQFVADYATCWEPGVS